MLEKETLEEYWNQMNALNEDKMVQYIKEQQLDQQETFQLFSMIQRKLYQVHGKSNTLEDYGRYILKIVEEYRQDATCLEEPNTLLHYANVMLYNLSADMAECWAEESFVKTKGCFEIGLQAAQECLYLRENLNKDNNSFAMAHWVLGMHQLSLHQLSKSLENFQKAFSCSVKSSEIASVYELTKENSFEDILYAGYLGIGSLVNGIAESEKIYDHAIELFKQQFQSDENKKEDASFGIRQLEHVKNKIANNILISAQINAD